MTALDRNPATTNFLPPLTFKFYLKRAPNINFFVQKVNIPGFSLPAANMATPFVEIPYGGDHIDFETLDIVFSVDEKMANFLELWSWLMSLGFPSDFSQYAALTKNPNWSGLGAKSEIVVSICDNSLNPIFHINYHDAFPIGLSSLDFDSRLDSPEPIFCGCSFRYSTYDIEPVT